MAELLPWQLDLWTAFTGRPHQPHAYLLHGPAGGGKRQLAECFAQFLLCQQPQENRACGQCMPCRLYAAGTHPDLFRIEPEEPGKGILISYVRTLVESIQQTSQQGGYQVIILAPAEVMTVESANALLKSLEEPAARTVFLLITHHLSFLLPTIKSRCVLQACPLPDKITASTWLAEKLPKMDAAQHETLLQLAAGSPLRALSFAQDGVLNMRQDVVEGVKQLLKRQKAPAELVGHWTKLPPLLLLEWFADWCQCLLRYQLTLNEADLGLADMQKVLEYMARFVHFEQLTATHNWLLERRQKLLWRAPLRTDLMLESLLVQWLALIGR